MKVKKPKEYRKQEENRKTEHEHICAQKVDMRSENTML
jgi:hypothetical protein